MQYRYIKLTINIFNMKKVYETLDMRVVKIYSSGCIAVSTIGGSGEGFSALDADGGNLDKIDEEEECEW